MILRCSFTKRKIDSVGASFAVRLRYYSRYSTLVSAGSFIFSLVLLIYAVTFISSRFYVFFIPIK